MATRSGKRSRYSNVKKVEHDGHKFDSARERDRYIDLSVMQRAGAIRDLELQPRIPIVIGGVEVRYPPKANGARGSVMVYVADFRYYDVERDRLVIEDVKMQSGFLPEIFKFKRALLYTMGVTIDEV